MLGVLEPVLVVGVLELVPVLGVLGVLEPVLVVGVLELVPVLGVLGVLEPVPVTGAFGSSSRLPGLMSAGDGDWLVPAVGLGSACAPTEKVSIAAKNAVASRPRNVGKKLEGGIHSNLGCAETNARHPDIRSLSRLYQGI